MTEEKSLSEERILKKTMLIGALFAVFVVIVLVVLAKQRP